MLVSTSSSGCLALAGIAQRADEIAVDLDAVGTDHESPLAFLERFHRQRLDPQPVALGCHFDLARSQTDMITQLLRYHQSTRLVNGCPHVSGMPRAYL